MVEELQGRLIHIEVAAGILVAIPTFSWIAATGFVEAYFTVRNLTYIGGAC